MGARFAGKSPCYTANAQLSEVYNSRRAWWGWPMHGPIALHFGCAIDYAVCWENAATKTKTKAVYQLKISLRDIEPLIWRRVQVWEDTRLPKLHRVLQLLFNWEDYHLHDFLVGQRVYSVPSEEDADFGRKDCR
jgi:hypothetical protein